MELFWKAISAVLIAVFLGLHIGKTEKEFGVLLTMAVSCMGTAAALHFLESVLQLLKELEFMANFNSGLLETILKCSGIALVAELADLICQDSGNGALGKTVQLLGKAGILYVSLPMIRMLLKLLQEILGEL